MFLQYMQGKLRDRGIYETQIEKWRTDVKPKAIGYLGSTSGVTDDGDLVAVARFESTEAAEANNDIPEQSAWWSEMEKAFDGEVTFIDCNTVDLVAGGGSDQAGFVQIMLGRAVDPQAMRDAGQSMEAELKEMRPDVLGGVVGWYGDRQFVQAMYFTSEADARKAEQGMADDPQIDEWSKMLDGDLTFIDIKNPDYD